jgi:hypothetical protein
MPIRSQADLEYQYHQRTAQVQSGTINPEHAFGNMDEWVTHLGERKAMLHPGLRQWMWYGRLHDEWVFAGCGVGEAILLSIRNVAGIKKLPQPGDPAGWCVYRQGQEAFGPMPVVEMLTRLKSQREQTKTIVWSPLATDWLSVAYEPGGEISFHDEAGNPVSVMANGEAAQASARAEPSAPGEPGRMSVPPPPPTVKKSNRNLIIAIVVIVILLCCCLPALIGIIYFVAKNAGVLPSWLGGTTWVPLFML